MTLLFEVKDLKKSYGSKPILRGLSFNIFKGEVVGLLGANGAGKTTAFYLAIGLIQPDAGEIFLNEKPITHLPIYKRAELGIGYLAQEPSVFKSLSVEENILCILEITEKMHGLKTKKEKEKRLFELLSEVNLVDHAQKKAGMLSGGERRRLEITRALITNPSLLLLDEPFANIDPLTIRDVKQMILFLKKKGISVLITDHNAREIFSITDRSCLVQDGKVILQASAEEMIQDPTARSCYLGEDFKL